MPTNSDGGFASVMERIVDLAEDVATDGQARRGAVSGIGVALAGNLDSRQGLCRFSPNLPDWRDVDVAGPLTKRFGVPVRMCNDANCAALAEHRFGAGRGTTNMAMLTLGTGVGGGVIVDGRLKIGPREGMGEFGHIIVDPDGPECGCGNQGCLEAFCGAAGIARAARQLLQQGRDSAILDLAGDDILAITPRVVSDAAAQGDAVAIEVFERIGNLLGIGVTSLAMVLDPDAVIIGGQIAQAGEPLFAPIRRTARVRARMIPFDADCIVPAALGGDAGALGAIALFGDDDLPEIQPS